MGKETGIGASLTIDDSGGTPCDISNDVSSWSVGTPQNMIEVTGIDKAALERLIGRQDAQLQLTTKALNDASGKSFDVLKSSAGSRTVVVAVSGNSLTMEMYISDKTLAMGDDGAIGWNATLMLNNGTVPAWA